MKPGSDMPCGCANSVTEAAPPSSCASTLRRVPSDRAAKTKSSAGFVSLTIWLSLDAAR